VDVPAQLLPAASTLLSMGLLIQNIPFPCHLLCRVEREERGAKGPLEALTDTLKGAADFVK